VAVLSESKFVGIKALEKDLSELDEVRLHVFTMAVDEKLQYF
jgi:hypothetical protein